MISVDSERNALGGYLLFMDLLLIFAETLFISLTCAMLSLAYL